MERVTQTNNARTPKTQSQGIGISPRLVLARCIAKWYWFAASVAVCLTAATVYIMSKPLIYTRSASVLIEDDTKKSKELNDEQSEFSNMDLQVFKLNVNNEIKSFQSPSLMISAVKHLGLDVSYKVKKTFRYDALYGDQLPIKAMFLSLSDQDFASMTATPDNGKGVHLTGFVKNGRKYPGKIDAPFGASVNTPVGKVVVTQSPNNSDIFGEPIIINKSSVKSAVGKYSGELAVELNDKQTSIVNLTMRDAVPERAEDVLDELIKAHEEQWRKNKDRITEATNEFIRERLNIIESELGDVDNSITAYKSDNLLPNLSHSAEMDMQQSSVSMQQIYELKNQLSVAKYLRDFVRRNNHKLLPANAGLEEMNLQTLIGEYNEKVLQRTTLVDGSSEHNVIVRDLDQKLASLRSTILSSIDNYMVSLNVRLKSAENLFASANKRISDNPKQARHLLSDERQQKVKETLYLYLLQKREENEMSRAFTEHKSRVIVAPNQGGVGIAPTPEKAKIVSYAFLVGLLIPLLVIILMERSNKSVRGRRDLDGLSAPLIGEIPSVGGTRREAFEQMTTLVKARKHDTDSSIAMVVRPDSEDCVNEAFRMMRTNIENAAGDHLSGYVIMFTSANNGSGKSFMSINTAISMAVKEKKVIVIDLDLRHKGLSNELAASAKGVANYLSGDEQSYKPLIVENVNNTGVDFMPTGDSTLNPAELISKTAYSQMLEELKLRYDYIILDCPPVGRVSDPEVITRSVDRTIFVVRAGLYKRSRIEELDKTYASGRFHDFCVLLNYKNCAD